jgi:RimJ/RimL family protein N-acetyltransferase
MHLRSCGTPTIRRSPATCSTDSRSPTTWPRPPRGPRGGRVWAIVVDGGLIGCIGFKQDSGWLRCNAEIGYWIGEAYWRRGIVSDAVRQVTDWAFAAIPDLTRLHAGIFAGNQGSQAVARHCGYVREGVLRQSAIKDGVVIDRVVWASYRTQMARRTADIDAALAITAANAMERS